MLLFSGLLACSLNAAIVWLDVISAYAHSTDPLSWFQTGKLAEVCYFLSVFAVLAGAFGEGRGQLPLLIAAIFGTISEFIL
jgi:hypothetical protein